MRFLLFDRVVEMVPKQRITVIKNVSTMDEYFTNHYTYRPIMPLTLVTEALAQAGGMLNLANNNFKAAMLLVVIEGVKIRRQIYAGDTLLLEVTLLRDNSYGATMCGEARIGTETVATLERIVYAHELRSDEAFIQQQYKRFQYQSGGYQLPEGILL